jgi:hypothetical protein
MNVLGENHILINKKRFREGMLRLSRGHSVRPVLLILGMWFAFTVINLVCGGELSQTLGYLPLVGLIAVFLCVYMPRHFVGQAWKAQCRKYGEETERVTYFYPDRMVITGEGLEKEVLYEDVVAVKTTRNLVILVFRDKIALLLAQNGFRGITKEEIMARISADT